MSALIRVLASKRSAQLRPGERTDLTLTVQNFSEIVDRYQISVEGIDPSWVTVSRTELSLFPKDQDQVRITLHPPTGPGTRAGQYSVQVQVASQETPDEWTMVPFELEVAALTAFELTLQPQKQSGIDRGVFSAQVSNPGNADLTVELEALDPVEGCWYIFNPAQIVVPAGQKRSVALEVRPKAPLPGKDSKKYSFTVTARPAEAPALTRHTVGEWVQMPRKQFNVRPFLVAGLVIIGLAAIALAAWKGLEWWSARPTPIPDVTRSAGATLLPTYTPLPTFTPLPGDSPQPENTPQPGTTPAPTAEPSQVPPTGATAGPSVVPTPDLQPELEAALWQYSEVRAEAEEGLAPDMLQQVCIDPYLSIKTARIEQNIQDGTHWETWSVDFSITSWSLVEENRAEVWVVKTETKVFFPKDSAVPDDEICQGPIYSYRDCTYEARYIMVWQDGRWYVAEAEAISDCVSECQN